jgi:alpha-D-xyloside xylohydrolase
MAPLHNPLVVAYGFPSTIPPLPSSDGLDPVVRANVRADGSHSLELDGTTARGAAVVIRLSSVASGVVRVELEPKASNGPTDRGRVKLARLPAEPSAWSVQRPAAGQVRLVADGIKVDVELEPVRLVFYGADGRKLLAQDPRPTDVTDRLAAPTFGLSCADGRVVACHDTFACEPDEHFYGFGEKFTNLDKRGQWIEMWNYDAHGVNSERAYKNVPFFVSSRGYGVFVDSTTPIRFDMAASHLATWSVVVPDAALDYYVIGGADPMEVIGRYANLVGKPILPPKWAFGLWVSSGFKADSTEATLARAGELREHGIPADVLHLDCYWQKWGCWSDLEWDADVFPDPERMLHAIKALGLRVCLWINPYIGIQSDRFRQASERGWLLRTRGGEAYVLQLWGGYHPPVGILDLSHPEAVDWFVGRLRELLRMGADVFKTDFGEGIPADAVAHDGTTGERLHNAYTLAYNDLVADVTAAETGRAGLVWGRSTYAGGQRHAAQWAGDPNCTYQDLASTMRGGLSLSASGHPFWSHDIGGFHGQPTPDLYVRWAQFGLLSPLSRLHGMTSRLPWDYGEQALRAFRDMVRLRYRLLPYLFTCAVESAATGQPIMRALALVYPGDPALASIDLEYLLGPDLLVAPIYNAESRRPVVFPPGQWVDVWSNEVIVGPATRQIEVPLERVPLYARGNALLPTTEPVEHLEEAPWGLVTFDAYLLDLGQATLRDLDGETHISAALDGASLDLRLSGARSRVGLRLLPVAGHGVEQVRLNGTSLPRRDTLTLHSAETAGWSMQADHTLVALLVTNPPA